MGPLADQEALAAERARLLQQAVVSIFCWGSHLSALLCIARDAVEFAGSAG